MHWLRPRVRQPGPTIPATATWAAVPHPAAVAGYPLITVPHGFVDGLPVGIAFMGRAWSEPTLIRLAYAFEQRTRRGVPRSCRSDCRSAYQNGEAMINLPSVYIVGALRTPIGRHGARWPRCARTIWLRW